MATKKQLPNWIRNIHRVPANERPTKIGELVRQLTSRGSKPAVRKRAIRYVQAVLAREPNLMLDALTAAREHAWKDRFLRMSPDRRKVVLESAVRLAADEQANEHERKLAVRQIEAMMEIDLNLAFDTFALVDAHKTAETKMRQLQQETAEAKADRQSLIDAVQALRKSMVTRKLIGKNDRLPDKPKQWDKILDDFIAARSHSLETKEMRLQLQEQGTNEKIAAAETQLRQILAEIQTAKNELSRNTPALIKGFSKTYASIRARTTDTMNGIARATIRGVPYLPGEMVPGQGIFTKLWEPKYSNGRASGIMCEVFAAPKTLESRDNNSRQSYPEWVRDIASLRGWHDHDGGDFSTENDVANFLETSAKNYVAANRNVDPYTWFCPPDIGKWFIPPREIVGGFGPSSNGGFVKISTENLYDLNATLAFRNTYRRDFQFLAFCSCTPASRSGSIYVTNFRTGMDNAVDQKERMLMCRPVRVGKVKLLTAVA